MGKKADIALCSIYSGGNKIPDTYELIYASIRTELNHIGKATLELYAGHTHEAPFEVSDHDIFKHGSDIRLEMKNDQGAVVLFEGFVVSTELTIEPNRPDLLTVECRDYAFLSTLGRQNRVYEKATDSDIMRKIIANYSDLSLKVEDTATEHPSLVQYYCTDWDFLLSRADANGLVIAAAGKQLTIGKPDVGASPVAEFQYGVDVYDFKGSLSLSGQYADVNAVAWNYTRQELMEEKGRKPNTNKQGDLTIDDLAKRNKNQLLLQTDAAIDKACLKTWADAMALRTTLSRYSGSFTVEGNGAVTAGCTITLKGLGKRYDGTLYVSSVEHILEENSWTTRIGMGLPRYHVAEQPDVAAPLASGLLPGIQGLHVGIVRQLHEDPAKEYRLLVELPLLNSEQKAVWARLTMPYAGTGTGFFFVPEVGEEVVVGFFNNDPCHPVVLGCMYSSKKKPPVPLEEKNNQKRIVSKEGLTLSFDEEKKTILITTPGGNLAEWNDDTKAIRIVDQQKNMFQMNDKGITLQSDKDIILQAKGNIQLDAQQKVTVTSKADVSFEGTNVKAAAKATISLKGNASAELSSSGNTVVKGSIVMIN